jgi:hypothetical protein
MDEQAMAAEANEQLAHRLLDAMQLDRRFDARLGPPATAVPIGDQPNDEQRAARPLLQRIMLTADQIRPAVARYYAEHLSADELRALIDFSSPQSASDLWRSGVPITLPCSKSSRLRQMRRKPKHEGASKHSQRLISDRQLNRSHVAHLKKPV